MTEKRLFVGKKKCEDRFTIITNYDGEIGVKENHSGDVLVLKHSDLNAQQFVAQLVIFLNDQNQAIVDLYDGSKYWSDKATEKIKELEKENEQLKNKLKFFNELNKPYGAIIKENEQLKQSLDYEQRMHEWFKNEAYRLQNKLDNREDEIINLKKRIGDVE